MMPLWLDLLRTPMAAPETRDLRTMRRTMQLLCIACLVSVLAIRPLVATFGLHASAAVAALLGVTAIHVALYVFRKNRADEAHLRAVTVAVAGEE